MVMQCFLETFGQAEKKLRFICYFYSNLSYFTFRLQNIRMLPIVTDVAWSMSVCLLVTAGDVKKHIFAREVFHEVF